MTISLLQRLSAFVLLTFFLVVLTCAGVSVGPTQGTVLFHVLHLLFAVSAAGLVFVLADVASLDLKASVQFGVAFVTFLLAYFLNPLAIISNRPVLTTIILGLVIGYLLATVSESVLHNYFGHASYRVRRFFQKWPVFGEVVHDVHFGHTVVHHAKTFKENKVTQFRSEEEHEQFDEYLFSMEKGQHIAVRYGLVTSYFGMVYFAFPPFAAACLISLCFGGCGWWFLLAAIVPISLPPLLSRAVHPYLHLSTEEADSKASLLVRCVLDSPYGVWAKKSHYVHHYHARYNFNLLPGGDMLLGCYRHPSSEEVAEMKRIGLLRNSVAG